MKRAHAEMRARGTAVAAIVTWFVCYVVFPAWYVPEGSAARGFVLAFFLLYFTANSVLLLRWVVRDVGSTGDFPRGSDWPGPEPGVALRNRVLLAAVAAVAVALHAYPMTLPILTRTDAHYHAAVAMPILKALDGMTRSLVGLGVRPLAWAVLLGTALVVLARRRMSRQREVVAPSGRARRPLRIAVAASAVCCAAAYFALISRSGMVEGLGPASRHLFRYPPLGKMLTLVPLALLGASEVSVRMLQLTFTVLAAAFSYRLVRLYRSERTACLAFALWLFVPVIFYYGHNSVLAAGVLFFAVAANFYFLRHLKEGRREDLAIACLVAGAGFLYKRLLGCLPVMFWAYLVLLHWRGRGRGRLREELGLYLRWSWIAVAPALPWLLLGSRYTYRNYDFDPARLASVSAWLDGVRLVPQAVTLPAALLLGASLVYALWRRRDTFTGAMVIWFLVYYFLISPSAGGGGYVRHSLIFYPPMIYLGVQMLADAGGSGRSRIVRMGVPAAAVVYLVAASVWLKPAPASSPYTGAYVDTGSRYVPYDDAIAYVRDRLPRGSRVLATMACEPSHFYLMMYGMEEDVVWYRKKWAEPAEQTVDNLHEFCEREGYEYVLFPRGREWLWDFVNEDMVEQLIEGSDHRFKPVATFRSGRNRIDLWKVELNGTNP